MIEDTRHTYQANDDIQLRMVRTQIGRTPYPIDHIGKTEFVIIPEDHIDYEVTALDERIIASARSHMVEARALPMPVADEGKESMASRWRNWRESLFADSEPLKSCEQVLHFAQRMVPFDHRAKWEDWFQWMHNILVNEFPWNEADAPDIFKLGDNPKSIPETLHEVDGCLRSNILAWHMRTLAFCLHYTGRQRQRVVEIGGGYGGLARLWLMLDKVETYTIVDLPEALFFAEVALRDEFGDLVGYWHDRDPGTQIILLPVTRLHEYAEKADLVINTGSFQEMSEEWVNFYMKWLDQCGAKFFYSLNYMGQPVSEMFESRSFWAPRPSPDQWITRVTNADIPLIKMMSINRSFCDVLYERGKPTRKFSEWSVLRGQFLDRQTYLEGLELLRQDFTVDTATQFIATLLNGKHTFKATKEMFYICGLLRMAGVTNFDKFLDHLDTANKKFAF